MMVNEGRTGSRLARLAVLCSIAGMLLIGGCTPWATYPEIAGSGGIHNPSLHPIPDLMGEAIWYVHSQDFEDPANDIGGRELVINLPPGTPATVYDKVIFKLSGDARPMRDASEHAYHVTEVRVRGTTAEVDVIHPSASGAPQLVTVEMRQDLRGFGTVGTRVWRFHVAAPAPNYVWPDAYAAEPTSDEFESAQAE